MGDVLEKLVFDVQNRYLHDEHLELNQFLVIKVDSGSDLVYYGLLVDEGAVRDGAVHSVREIGAVVDVSVFTSELRQRRLLRELKFLLVNYRHFPEKVLQEVA